VIATSAIVFALLAGPAEDDVTPPPPPSATAPTPPPPSAPQANPPPTPPPPIADPGEPVLTHPPAARPSDQPEPQYRAKRRAERLEDLYEKENTFDANIDGGGGAAFGSSAEGMGFIRGRAGLMIVRAPWFYMVGPTAEWSNIAGVAFGGQGEVMHLTSGFWTELGGQVDLHGKPGGNLSVGWSMVGVEGQVRGTQDLGTAVTVLAKLRIPLGVIIFAARQK
jgi:hypothetical protein